MPPLPLLSIHQSRATNSSGENRTFYSHGSIAWGLLASIASFSREKTEQPRGKAPPRPSDEPPGRIRPLAAPPHARKKASDSQMGSTGAGVRGMCAKRGKSVSSPPFLWSGAPGGDASRPCGAAAGKGARTRAGNGICSVRGGDARASRAASCSLLAFCLRWIRRHTQVKRCCLLLRIFVDGC
jgi:hypothetical protein